MAKGNNYAKRTASEKKIAQRVTSVSEKNVASHQILKIEPLGKAVQKGKSAVEDTASETPPSFYMDTVASLAKSKRIAQREVFAPILAVSRTASCHAHPAHLANDRSIFASNNTSPTKQTKASTILALTSNPVLQALFLFPVIPV